MASGPSSALFVAWAIIVHIGCNEAQVSLPFQCSFESDDLCGMTQRTDDQFDWIQHTGPTPSRKGSQDTGPDRAWDGAYYIYIEASDHGEGEKAILATPPLRGSDSGVICVQFWYHMYTSIPANMGRLVVFRDSRGEGNPLFDVGSVNKGDQWIPAQITVRGFQYNDKIVFLGKARKDFRGDMALDMIDIQGGACDACYLNNDGCDTGYHLDDDGLTCIVSQAFQCSFETGDLCGMTQKTDDQFDWMRHSGSTISRTWGTGPYGALDGDYYLYIEGSDHGDGESAIIETPPLSIGGAICVQFWYHMYTSNPLYMGRLVVFAESQGEGNPLFDVGGMNKGDKWILAQITVTEFHCDDKIVFLHEERNGRHDDMALDMIDIRDGACSDACYLNNDGCDTGYHLDNDGFTCIVLLPFQCSFESDDLCGMTQRTDDQFDWTRHRDTTLSQTWGTGPYGALDGDYYIYIESSDHGDGERAIIETPPLRFSGAICVQFWYHMYTSHPSSMGRLVVFTESRGEGNPLFDVSGESKGDQWILEQITVTGFQCDDKIVFLNEERGGLLGDMALDMIDIRDGACDACSLNNGGCDAYCVSDGEGTRCECDVGYDLDVDGFRCFDDNECAANGGHGDCSHTCDNTPGSYTCSCTSGYELEADGRTCQDIDECAPNGGKGDCGHQCYNTPGSYRCDCDSGYTLNGDQKSCDDINECSENGGKGPCDVTCENNPGSYTCYCPDGEHLQNDGTTCAESSGWDIYVLNTTWTELRPEGLSNFPLWQLLTGVFVGAAALGVIIAVVTVCIRKQISSGEGEGRTPYENDNETITRHETTTEERGTQPEGHVYDKVFTLDVQTTRGPNDAKRHETTVDYTGTQPEGHIYNEVFTLDVQTTRGPNDVRRHETTVDYTGTQSGGGVYDEIFTLDVQMTRGPNDVRRHETTVDYTGTQSGGGVYDEIFTPDVQTTRGLNDVTRHKTTAESTGTQPEDVVYDDAFSPGVQNTRGQNDVTRHEISAEITEIQPEDGIYDDAFTPDVQNTGGANDVTRHETTAESTGTQPEDGVHADAFTPDVQNTRGQNDVTRHEISAEITETQPEDGVYDDAFTPDVQNTRGPTDVIVYHNAAFHGDGPYQELGPTEQRTSTVYQGINQGQNP